MANCAGFAISDGILRFGTSRAARGFAILLLPPN